MATNTELQDGWVPTNRLRPHPQNSRKHSKAQISQIAASIEEFGFRGSIVVDENGVILAGHGSWAGEKACRHHGPAPQVNARGKVKIEVARGLSDTQKRAYIIADNRLAEESTWDKDKLLAEVQSLMTSGFDLEFMNLGKLDDDLAALVGNNVDDETPEDRRDREEGADAKRKRTNSKDVPPDGEPSDPSKDKDSMNFPLYVILNPPQYKQWKEMRGALSDKQAVLALIERRAAVQDLLKETP